jgi:tRNA threonylcarbamoyladenosine biosynthesis protein TsaB
VLIVAIESAAEAAGVAIADSSGTIAQQTVARGRRHAETIAPAIRACCESAGLKVQDFDAVAVDVGPGLFTGLRVGIATARGLAYALRRPVVAVNSLEVLAAAACAVSTLLSPASTTPWHVSPRSRENARDTEPNPDAQVRGSPLAQVIPVMDARRGEVVSAGFSLYPAGNSPQIRAAAPVSSDRSKVQLIRDSEDLLETPAGLVTRLSGLDAEGPPRLLVGDGALRYSGMLSESPAVRIGPRWLASPPVNVLAEIGIERAMSGHFDDPVTVLPRYVRQADTRINWTTRAPRAPREPAT